jgi:predicted Fe-S protein YdhL (DUF1289 family)
MGKDPTERGATEEVSLPHPPLRIFDSPCKSVCRIDDRFGWCVSCRRTRNEIKAWSTASEGEKKAILERLPKRAAEETKLLA